MRQDANQNGISETGELKALAELNIESIGVVGFASNIHLDNGNTTPLAATFTRTNWSAGASERPDVSGSLLLAANNFYQEFTDDPEVTEDAAALPQMGWRELVRELREVMSLMADMAEELRDSVQVFAGSMPPMSYELRVSTISKGK